MRALRVWPHTVFSMATDLGPALCLISTIEQFLLLEIQTGWEKRRVSLMFLGFIHSLIENTILTKTIPATAYISTTSCVFWLCIKPGNPSLLCFSSLSTHSCRSFSNSSYIIYFLPNIHEISLSIPSKCTNSTIFYNQFLNFKK